MGGHMEATKTYSNAKKYYYWPGLFDWICALTANCLTCQNDKPKPKHRNEVPLEQSKNETVPFRTVHIDHKGPHHRTRSSNVRFILIFETFLRVLVLYPVHSTTALGTTSAVEKWILSFRTPQSIIHNSGTIFINTEFVNYIKELGIFLGPRTAHWPWTNGKMKPRTNLLPGIGEVFLMRPETTCLHSHRSLHSRKT